MSWNRGVLYSPRAKKRSVNASIANSIQIMTQIANLSFSTPPLFLLSNATAKEFSSVVRLFLILNEFLKSHFHTKYSIYM